jgi:hypothetical protein
LRLLPRPLRHGVEMEEGLALRLSALDQGEGQGVEALLT